MNLSNKNMTRLLLCLPALLLFTYSAIAVTDVSLHSGSAAATYSESTDSQSKELKGSDSFISIRNLNTFSFVDLGLDIGALKSPAALELSGDTGTHDINFLSNYANLTAGISFSLYPSWIEYYFDLGYRMGIGKLEVLRTESGGGVKNYTFNSYTNDLIYKYGIKFVILRNLLLGINYETKNTLMSKKSDVLNPKLDSANSMTFSVGFRFGASQEVSTRGTPDGTKNYYDPCRLFHACD